MIKLEAHIIPGFQSVVFSFILSRLDQGGNATRRDNCIKVEKKMRDLFKKLPAELPNEFLLFFYQVYRVDLNARSLSSLAR